MATALNVYRRGNLVITHGEWRVPDEAGTLTDPTTVVFTARRRGDTPTPYTYGTDPEVTRVSAGIFELALDHTASDQVGDWCVHAQGTGDAHAADDIDYKILPSGALA